jgi:hypothetical protein
MNNVSVNIFSFDAPNLSKRAQKGNPRFADLATSICGKKLMTRYDKSYAHTHIYQAQPILTAYIVNWHYCRANWINGTV